MRFERFLTPILVTLSVTIAIFVSSVESTTWEKVRLNVKFKNVQDSGKEESITFWHLGESFNESNLAGTRKGNWELGHKGNRSGYAGTLTIRNTAKENEISIFVSGPGVQIKGISESDNCVVTIEGTGEKQEYKLQRNGYIDFRANRSDLITWVVIHFFVTFSFLQLPMALYILKVRPLTNGFLLRQELIVAILAVTNVIWSVCEPGFFSFDAEQILMQTESTDDVVPVSYSIFYRALSIIFGREPSWLMLIQFYTLSLMPFFIADKALGLDMPKKSVKCAIGGLIVFTLLIINPIYIGSITLMYFDYLFLAALYLFIYVFIDLIEKRASVFRWGCLIALSLFVPFCRTNGIFLFPVFSILLTVLYLNQNSKGRVLLKDIRLYIGCISVLAVYIVLNTFSSLFYIKEKQNYYITVPLYELVGVCSLNRETVESDYPWISNYMDIEKVLFRYDRSNCLIPVFTVAAGRGELDMQSIQKDHQKILGYYVDSVRKNFPQHVRIKFRHFLYTLGFGGYNNAPYFSDNLPWSRMKTLVVEDLQKKGIYENREFISELGQIALVANHMENRWIRFIIVSALFPLIFMLLWSLVCIYRILKVQKTRDYDYALFGVFAIMICYSFSYLAASHGGFSKYQFPVYTVGLIFFVTHIFRFAFGRNLSQASS